MQIPMLLDEAMWLDYVRDRGVGAMICLTKVPIFSGCLSASKPMGCN